MDYMIFHCPLLRTTDFWVFYIICHKTALTICQTSKQSDFIISTSIQNFFLSISGYPHEIHKIGIKKFLFYYTDPFYKKNCLDIITVFTKGVQNSSFMFCLGRTAKQSAKFNFNFERAVEFRKEFWLFCAIAWSYFFFLSVLAN